MLIFYNIKKIHILQFKPGCHEFWTCGCVCGCACGEVVRLSDRWRNRTACGGRSTRACATSRRATWWSACSATPTTTTTTTRATLDEPRRRRRRRIQFRDSRRRRCARLIPDARPPCATTTSPSSLKMLTTLPMSRGTCYRQMPAALTLPELYQTNGVRR